MLRSLILFAVVSAPVGGLPAPASAEEKAKPDAVKIGDKAPKFVGRTDEGKRWKSADHVGKKILVVYFYPADMTGGCTKQACGYRDALAELERDDVEVVGVSGDSVENHRHFKERYDLTFTLLADPKGKIAEAFGVKTGPGGIVTWEKGDQKIDLKRGVTASRWTFVIDRRGRIVHIDKKVNPAKDAEDVLNVIEKLPKGDA